MEALSQAHCHPAPFRKHPRMLGQRHLMVPERMVVPVAQQQPAVKMDDQ